MATPQQPMAPGGPRPSQAQGPPPQNLVLPHAHPQQPQLIPMMQNPAAAHFAPGGNFPPLPMQHPRPVMNGIQPNAHANFAAMQNPNVMAARQLRQFPAGMGPGAALGQLGPYPHQQMQHPMYTQQLSHLPQFQQGNPQLRMNAQQQQQLIPSQHLIQQQAVSGTGIQHIATPQAGQPMVPATRSQLVSIQRFTQFALHLSSNDPGKSTALYWKKFVEDWFVPQASVRLVFGEGPQAGKEYELPRLLIHHFFHSIHTSGIRQMCLILGGKLRDSAPNVIDCPKASVLYRLDNASQIIWDGEIKVQFKQLAGQDLKVEKLEIVNDEFTELVPRKTAKQTLTPPLSNRSTSPDAKRSPLERNAMLGQMGGDGQSSSDQEDRIILPKSDINDIGLPKAMMSFLEVVEVCVYIQPLINFSQQRELQPQQALKLFPSNQAGKQFSQPSNAFVYSSQPNQHTSPMTEISPLPHHANLPATSITNSPHYPPSPMSSQTSQTGQSTTPLMSNRQAPGSAPSKLPQSNKRRRGSGVANMPVKEEDEEAIGNPPSKHPKQSPRISIGRGGPGGPAGKRMTNES